MQLNKEKIIDSTLKIFYLLVPLFVGGLYFYILSYFKSYISNSQFNIHVNYSYTSLTLFIGFSLFFCFLFLKKIKSSNFNNFWIEKKIKKTLDKTTIFLPKTIYCFFFLSFISLLLYFFIDFILKSSIDINFIHEYNMLTLEKLNNYNYLRNSAIYQSFIIFFIFLFFLLIESKEKINDYFYIGLFILPIFFNFIFGFTPSEVQETIQKIELSSLSSLSSDLFLNSLFNSLFGFVIFLIFLFIFKLCKKSKKINYENIIKQFKSLVIGYLAGRVFLIAILYFTLTGTSLEILNSKNNDAVITVNNIDYDIDVTVKSKQKNSSTEFLLETYSGISIHNSEYFLNYIVNYDYNGDKEKAIQLSAYLQLNFAQNMSKKKDKMLFSLNSGVSMKESIPMLINLIIYEAAPIEKTENTFELIINKKYQEAVDSYITDNLNSNLDLKSVFTNRSLSNNIGHNTLSSLIASIINNNYATIDYNKIIDLELREELKNEIENKKTFRDFHIEEDLIKEWFNIFNIKS